MLSGWSNDLGIGQLSTMQKCYGWYWNAIRVVALQRPS